MSSLILRTVARALQPVLLLYAVFLLVAGHNEPGGGFVAGLVASAAVALYAIAHDVETARQLIPLEPRTLVGCGLLLAFGSGVWALLRGESFMTGHWVTVPPTGLAVGTPLLFDLGVFLLVVGGTLLMILSIAEER
jgi:multicomponent Na+:H+ antiporter subunit B